MAEALLEQIECPLCNSSDYELMRAAAYPPEVTRQDLLSVYSAASEEKLFDAIVQCRECSLIYLNPRVRADIILESYSSAKRPATDATFVRQNEHRVATFRRSLRHLIKAYGLAPSRSSYVLDVGCASGAFPKAAHDLGFTAIGVEPNRWMAERGRRVYGLDVRTGVLEDQDFGGRKFDLITLWDVIEHLVNPCEIVSIIGSHLKDDGLLVVNFPNHDSLARRLLGQNWPMYANVHLTYFTSKTMTRLLAKMGFQVIRIRPFYQTLELGYVLKRAAAKFRVFGPVERCIAGTAAYHLPMTYNIGQSFLVARKQA